MLNNSKENGTSNLSLVHTTVFNRARLAMSKILVAITKISKPIRLGKDGP